MSRRVSKRHSENVKAVDKNKAYPLLGAIAALKSLRKTKFDETVELTFNLRVDTKKPEHMVRGTVVLPHGTGRVVRVLVFCKSEAEAEARQAGADYVGAQELMNKVASGWLDFDSVVAMPDMMRDLSKLGKILGPRGLMPSPKTGTVTQNVALAIKELKAGKIEFKVDKQGGVHAVVGKISFDDNKLYENASLLIETLGNNRPASIKGEFIKSIYISSTMGPALKVSA